MLQFPEGPSRVPLRSTPLSVAPATAHLVEFLMISTSLQAVADSVTRRAQRQGFIRPSEVREELSHAGFSENLWKDVLALARSALSYRHGRYYYRTPVSDRVLQEQTQQR